jgi:hypothetical protein
MDSHPPDRLARRRDRLADIALFCLTAVLVAYPAVVAVLRFGMMAPFKFFANDTFYYLTTARRSIGVPFFTYDGFHPTNGFHPLWQYLLAYLFETFKLGGSQERQIFLCYGLSAVFCAIGFGLFAVAASGLTRNRALALLTAVPGFYDILFARMQSSTIDSPSSSPWSFINGMESPLSLLWFGLFACLLFRGKGLSDLSPRRLLLMSSVLALGILSRLDDVFLLAAFLVYLWVVSKSHAERLRRGFYASVVPGFAIGSYLIYNLKTTGMLMPVSGSVKSSAGTISGLSGMIQLFVPMKLWSISSLYSWDALHWRALQLAVPPLVAGAFLLHALLGSRKEKAAPGDAEAAQRPDEDADAPFARHHREALYLLAGYVVLKAAYNFIGVDLMMQGHWYFPLSISIVNLLFAYQLRNLWKARLNVLRFRFAEGVGLESRLRPLLLGLGLAALLIATTVLRSSQVHQWGPVAGGVFGLLGVALVVLSRRIAARGAAFARTGRPIAIAVGPIFALLFAVASANSFVNLKSDSHYNDLIGEFWSHRAEINKELALAAPGVGLVEVDDGIMAYSLDMSTMAGNGLSVDREMIRAIRDGQLFDKAYQRGYRIIASVTSWSYLDHLFRDFQEPKTDAEIVRFVVERNEYDERRYAFSVLRTFSVGDRRIYFLAFEPRSPAARGQ